MIVKHLLSTLAFLLGSVYLWMWLRTINSCIVDHDKITGLHITLIEGERY
jgi:hypothetical protein